jgi:hypothetical protein
MNLNEITKDLSQLNDVLSKFNNMDLFSYVIDNNEGLSEEEKNKARNMFNDKTFKNMVENKASESELKSYINKKL